MLFDAPPETTTLEVVVVNASFSVVLVAVTFVVPATEVFMPSWRLAVGAKLTDGGEVSLQAKSRVERVGLCTSALRYGTSCRRCILARRGGADVSFAGGLELLITSILSPDPWRHCVVVDRTEQLRPTRRIHDKETSARVVYNEASGRDVGCCATTNPNPIWHSWAS